MPQIHLMQPGQPVADFSVAGSVVTVAGVIVDAAERQGDSSVVVEVRHSGASARSVVTAPTWPTSPSPRRNTVNRSPTKKRAKKSPRPSACRLTLTPSLSPSGRLRKRN